MVGNRVQAGRASPGECTVIWICRISEGAVVDFLGDWKLVKEAAAYRFSASPISYQLRPALAGESNLVGAIRLCAAHSSGERNPRLLRDPLRR